MENYVANVGRGLIPFPGAEALAPLFPLQMSPRTPAHVQDDVASIGRLIPFPGAEALSPLLPSRMSPLSDGRVQSEATNVVPANVAEQFSAIVSQADSVLRAETGRGAYDLDMARGVLAARQSNPSSRALASDAGNPLRQVYDFVDQLAAAWPSLQGYRPGASQPEASHADPLAELRSPAVKPGQRARISMTVCNYESRPVWLVPAATDLLGSREGRIAGGQLEFSPRNFKLEPQEKMDVSIELTVPTETVPGCYSGLFVVRGVDYLRALVTIDVT